MVVMPARFVTREMMTGYYQSNYISISTKSKEVFNTQADPLNSNLLAKSLSSSTEKGNYSKGKPNCYSTLLYNFTKSHTVSV